MQGLCQCSPQMATVEALRLVQFITFETRPLATVPKTGLERQD